MVGVDRATRRVITGHALEVLRQLPDRSVDCVITSPPYYRKRDYGDSTAVSWPDGWVGQLGQEPTPDQFVSHLADVFDEVRRVMKPSANLFVVIDDTFAPSRSYHLVPERLAIEMVRRGFVLREKIVWAKKVYLAREGETRGNAMPEPVRNRLAHVWEYVYRFVIDPKAAYYNLDAVRVGFRSDVASSLMHPRQTVLPIDVDPDDTAVSPAATVTPNSKYALVDMDALNLRSPAGRLTNLLARGEADRVRLAREALTNVNDLLKRKYREWASRTGGNRRKLAELTGIRLTTLEHYLRTDTSGAALPSREAWERLSRVLDLPPYDEVVREEYRRVLPTFHPLGANPGDVLQFNVRPFRGAHFAVFPEDLVSFLMDVGCPPKVCPRCGRPWVPDGEGGLRPDCACGADPVPGVVLDPFAGTGTVGRVARARGLGYVMVEANPDYVREFMSDLQGDAAVSLGSSAGTIQY